MQVTQDMTRDSEGAVATEHRTAATGLEAWLADLQGEPAQPDAGTHVAHEDPEPAVAGPVNAAEALALSLALGTFSSARKLIGPDGAELVVDPEQKVYYFESTSLKPLAALLEQEASAWAPVYSEGLKAARAVNPTQALERLRWYAGLIATPGILNRKLSHAERYKLSRWPETEREFPKHFRIAKEMLKEAATPAVIAETSGMPCEEVIDYINASFAAGRLATTASAQTGRDAAPAESRRARLIAVLNKPLFTH